MVWLRGVLLGGFIASIVALLLFGPRPKLGGEQDGVTVIDYWEKWGGLEGRQMQEIVAEFNATVGKQRRIRVRYLSVSRVNEKTLVATAAGVPPDVAGIWEANIPQFASLDALEPLDDLVAAYNTRVSPEYRINEEFYKPVYWQGCRYDGRLFALVSTPWVLALHYDKRVFSAEAEALRARGLDPDRPPRTLFELDRYAEALDRRNHDNALIRAGYLPLHPGWTVIYAPFWFGAEFYDESARRLTLATPQALAAYRWIRSYSERLGVQSITDFRSGLDPGTSPLDPFLVGAVAMEQQGPWRANYFEELNPAVNRWRMSKAEEKKLPPDERHVNYAWGAAPFPSADGRELVGYAGFDVLAIPRGARHRREAFEFIAYVNRPEVMEKLCAMHSKNSPLRRVSTHFLETHPNPYVKVFEALAASENARTVPRVPIWPEVSQELNVAAQKVYLLEETPERALAQAERRLQPKLDRFFELDDRRKRAAREDAR